MTATARRSLRGLFALLVSSLLVALGGCGLSGDAQPRDIAGLVVSPTTTAVGGGGESGARVFLLGPQHLAEVERQVVSPTSAVDVLSALLAGPSSDESARGLRTAIPSGTKLQDAHVERSTARVEIDLSREFLAVQGVEQRNAVAQLVYTATSIPGVDSVLFHIEGRPVQVPVDDGSLTSEPLTRYDYPSLDPTRLPGPIAPNPGATTTSSTTTLPPTTTTTSTTVAPSTTRRRRGTPTSPPPTKPPVTTAPLVTPFPIGGGS